jgi:hypothetical protein
MITVVIIAYIAYIYSNIIIIVINRFTLLKLTKSILTDHSKRFTFRYIWDEWSF